MTRRLYFLIFTRIASSRQRPQGMTIRTTAAQWRRYYKKYEATVLRSPHVNKNAQEHFYLRGQKTRRTCPTQSVPQPPQAPESPGAEPAKSTPTGGLAVDSPIVFSGFY